tara:strand:+ start:174 stop:380 length:207 start_codon:yes stop_codon:yes gene_type:complete
MESINKKFEEQITYLQLEISQMSDELYSQQKEISVLKKQISLLKKKIDEFDNGIVSNINKEDKKPPHY